MSCLAVTKSCWPVFRAAQGKGPSTVCPALLQLFSGFPIQACVKTSINRCHCSDKKLLPACFAEQHRGRDQALSVQHCCNSLVVSYPGLCEKANINRCHCSDKKLLSACLQSSTGEETKHCLSSTAATL